MDESAQLGALAWSNVKASAHSCKCPKARPPLFGGMKKLRVPYVGKQFGTPGGVGLTVHEAIELHLTDCRQRSQNQHIKKGAPD
jgi:hypothetical protein